MFIAMFDCEEHIYS